MGFQYSNGSGVFFERQSGHALCFWFGLSMYMYMEYLSVHKNLNSTQECTSRKPEKRHDFGLTALETI